MVIRYLNDELTHHGVKGQEWGVKNGPPYPLTSVGKKRNQANAKYKKQRSIIESKSSTKKQKDKVSAGLAQMSGMNRFLEVQYDQGYTKDPTKFKKMSDVIERMIDEGSLFDSDMVSPFRTNSDGGMEEIGTFSNHSTVTSSDLMNVNGFHRSHLNDGIKLEQGYNNNCLKCSAALELRRRGLNVSAGGCIDGGNGASALSYWFNNAVAYKESSTSVSQRLRKFGRRASAEINFRYPNGAGGHSMYVQNDQQNNPMFYDGQTGKSFKSLDEVFDLYGFDREAKVNVTRLDNATPNFKHMAQDNVLELPGSGSSRYIQDKRDGKVYKNW